MEKTKTMAAEENHSERLRIIISRLMAPGSSQKTADEQTKKLKQLLLEIQTNKG
jgi:hypothetical protein